MIALNKTIRGEDHIRKGIPCEDASNSVSDSEIQVIALSDGHGSSDCFRSAIGSELAVEIAKKNLLLMAKNLSENDDLEFFLRYPRKRAYLMRQLTDTVVSEWTKAVNDHFKRNPLSKEEEKFYSPTHSISYIYGATLLAALKYKDYIFCIHQGDGRFFVVYEDGEIDQAVPWDQICEGNSTTSLCNLDASNRFRNEILFIKDRPIAAIFLCSDGVEDSYRDTYADLGGLHEELGGAKMFTGFVLCALAEFLKKGTFGVEFLDSSSHSKNDQEEWQDKLDLFLNNFLSNFSRTGSIQMIDENTTLAFETAGSGDDISIATLFDPKSVINLQELFEKKSELYNLEEELSWLEKSELSKVRKRDYLPKLIEKTSENILKIEESKSNLYKELDKIQLAYDYLSTNLNKNREEFGAKKDLTEESTWEELFLKEVFSSPLLALLFPEINPLNDRNPSTFQKLFPNNKTHSQLRSLKKRKGQIQQELQQADTEAEKLKEKRTEAIRDQMEIDHFFNSSKKRKKEVRAHINALQKEVESLQIKHYNATLTNNSDNSEILSLNLAQEDSQKSSLL